MIANPAMSYPTSVPRQFTLNDFRVRSYVAEDKSSNSTLTVSGVVLVVVLALGAFVSLDPLALFVPPEAKPASPAFVPSTEPARQPAMKEIIAPQPAVPVMKPIEEPAVTTPMVQTPHASAGAVRNRSGSKTPESRTNRMDKKDTTVLPATPEVKSAPPVLLAKPEEKTEAPIVLNRDDAIKGAPKPAATNDQPAVKAETN